MNKSRRGDPLQQYIAPERVLPTMARHAESAVVERSIWQNLILAIMGGLFIGAGALFSLLLSAGVDAQGPKLLLTGLGFSTGFFLVILSHSVLFTEANVLVSARFLSCRAEIFYRGIAIFWVVAAIGNLFGTWAFGQAIHFIQPLHGETLSELLTLTDKKLSFAQEGTSTAWWRAVLSGVLANWLVGMAAFFALMGRTIMGKYIPVFLAVTLFVAANFQHSPANAGYFALLMPTGQGPGWGTALAWNLAPAALGNIIGALTLVALPFHFAFSKA